MAAIRAEDRWVGRGAGEEGGRVGSIGVGGCIGGDGEISGGVESVGDGGDWAGVGRLVGRRGGLGGVVVVIVVGWGLGDGGTEG